MWLQGHLLLDDGAELCPACDAVGAGTYCQQCGAAKTEETGVHTCPQCRLRGPGPYCVHCGAVLVDPIEDELAHGTFDWQQWLHDLQPFLGGMTAKERDLLARNP
jgi:hypothetical protein